MMLITTLVTSSCTHGGVSVNVHYSSLTAPNLQHTANQGLYNFRFTILMNINNTSNYQSTNETHYTQENTTTTTHKRS